MSMSGHFLSASGLAMAILWLSSTACATENAAPTTAAGVFDFGAGFMPPTTPNGTVGLRISNYHADVIKDSHDHPRILKVPTQVPNIDAAYVAAGSDHSIAVGKDGEAYAWGFSTSYQTGLGTDEEVEVAQHIDNTAVRGKQLVWAGAGGQFSVMAGLAGVENVAANGVNGHA